MGAIHFGLDPDLAKLLIDKLRIRVLFETGTFQCATALSMAPLFERICTVELSETLHKDAIRKLAHCPNVEAINGSSPEVLRARAAELCRDRVLYWLDAHWCDVSGAGGATEECVLLAELQAIGRLNENSAVLIDDARFFLAPPPPPHDPAQWPDLLKVVTELHALSDRHALYVVNDVILFVPTHIANEIVTYGRTKGVDLLDLAQAARKNHNTAAPLQAMPADGHGLHANDAGRLHQAAFDAFKRQQFAEAVRLFRAAYDLDGSLVRHSHIAAAHAMLLSCDWAAVSRLLPANTNWPFSSGWLNSIYGGLPVNAAGEPIPWYTYPATEFIENKIPPNATVFEWGCGHSTLWWARRAAQVRSVEGNHQWYTQIFGKLPVNAKLSFAENQTSYVETIRNQDIGKFDVIVVDGDFRNECAEAAAAYLKPDGFIVFDNSDGREFDAGVRHLNDVAKYRIDFFGIIPSFLYKNCTSVFFRDPAMLARGALPSRTVSSVGPSCWQAMGH
jgi:hypothetical protein